MKFTVWVPQEVSAQEETSMTSEGLSDHSLANLFVKLKLLTLYLFGLFSSQALIHLDGG